MIWLMGGEQANVVRGDDLKVRPTECTRSVQRNNARDADPPKKARCNAGMQDPPLGGGVEVRPRGVGQVRSSQINESR